MSMSFLARRLAICLILAAPAALHAQGVVAQGPETPIVPAGLAGDQVSPDVTLTPNGGFVVWEDNSVTHKGLRVRAVRLDGGLAAGTPFTVSSAWKSKAAGNQEKPRVAPLQDGGAVIVWQGGGRAGKRKRGRQQVFARFISPSGEPRLSDIRVSGRSKFNQADPAVAVLSDGSAVVVWSSAGQDGSRQGIFAQRLSPNGAKIGGEFQVNLFTLNNQRSPAVTALAGGGFVVVWISELQRNVADVYGRIYDAAGNAVSGELSLNPPDLTMCARPAVVGAADGGFVAAWNQREAIGLVGGGGTYVYPGGGTPAASTNSWDVYGRVFDAAGAGVGDPMCLNSYKHGDQIVPRLSRSGTTCLAVWTSLRQDGSWEGVYGQVLEDGALAGPEIRVNTTTFHRQIHPAVASDGAGRFLAVWSSFVELNSFDLLTQAYAPAAGE